MITKSEYAKLLLRDEWKEVRIRILTRDNYTCRSCKSDNCKLNVHHEVYLQDKMPWEVPDTYLITLCDKCHSKEHENRLISSFIKKRNVKDQKSKTPIKTKTLTEPEKKMVAKLTILQKVYPNSKIWFDLKKRIFEFKTLSVKQKKVLNETFDKVVKKANKNN